MFTKYVGSAALSATQSTVIMERDQFSNNKCIRQDLPLQIREEKTGKQTLLV